MADPIDFPDSPVDNTSWLGPNGILYFWDGTKWTLKIESEDLLNYWARSAPERQLYPRNEDDEILFASLGVDYLNNLP